MIAAAESAANVAIFMKTSAPAGGEAAEVDAGLTMEFEPNMAIFGPEGWEPSQIRAEQPTTTYGEFKHEILNEIARCLKMPFNIALPVQIFCRLHNGCYLSAAGRQFKYVLRRDETGMG